MKILLDIVIMLSISLYDTITEIILNPYKGFVASFTGVSVCSAPSYISIASGHQIPEFIMNLQTLGLIITIILGTLSCIKVLWDLIDKLIKKFKKSK